MKFVFSLVMILTLTASVASAQLDSYIGIFADEAGTTCDMATPVYQYATIYIYAHIEPGELGGDVMTGVEFKIDGYPEGAGGIISPVWSSPLVIGDNPAEGIAVAWTIPVEMDANGFGLIGTIDFFTTVDGWIGPDHRMGIMPADASGNRAIVDGDFETHQVGGRAFWFNCVDAPCVCDVNSATEEASWGSVKSLY